MHRQMIAAVNAELARIADPRYPRIVGWLTVPQPGDPDYPVAAAWQTGTPGLDACLQRVKADAFFDWSLVPSERDLTDTQTLSRMDFGRAGSTN